MESFGWRAAGLEGWRVGGLEVWRAGGLGLETERLEACRKAGGPSAGGWGWTGGLEGWRAGRWEGPLSEGWAPTFKHPDLDRFVTLPPWAPALGRPPYIEE